MRMVPMKFWLPPVIYTGLIIFASSLPGGVVSEYSLNVSDKLLHTLHFLFYGLTLMWAFTNTQPIHSVFRNAYLKTILVGISVGCLDAFYQSFMPTRTSSGWDILADSTGIILAGVTFYLATKLSVVERVRSDVKTDQN